MAATVAALKNIPVARPEFGREEEEAVAATLRTGWVSQGPQSQSSRRSSQPM